ncbi:copper resistance CopC family protein [Bacillus sp. J33]|uniref:copper resistance CopC family protein n=1 Tax=Bacillus sp. J33 TaxID=935836 RepID=UPI0004798021|nr:copper resistance CopC family protein [Bacillus sp. J33]
MKKKVLFWFCLLLIIPSMASAHTELKSSVPASGQIVTGDLNEIVLTFAGEIESLSTMTLVMDGKEVPLSTVKPEGDKMIGTLSSALNEGSYTIHWEIAGEDGHQITGEIPFTVQLEEKAEQNTEATEPDSQKEEPNEQATAAEEPSSNMFMNILIPVISLLVLGAGLYLLFGRKRH